MRLRELALGALVGVGLGLGAAWLLRGSPAPGERRAAGGEETLASAGAVAELEQRIADLAERLAREESRRRDLESRLAALTGAEPPQEPPPPEEPPPASGSQPFVDTDVLARAGFAPSEVAELRARFEAVELERLYLRDQATREGWIGKPRFRQRLRELETRTESLREEYGADAYDWILYASNRPNRVVVRRVMEGSEAEAAGFREGDLVLRYEGERIFDVRSLQQATGGGRFGETTAVEVERDGGTLRLFPARGPLGVGLGTVRQEPERPPF